MQTRFSKNLGASSVTDNERRSGEALSRNSYKKKLVNGGRLGR